MFRHQIQMYALAYNKARQRWMCVDIFYVYIIYDKINICYWHELRWFRELTFQFQCPNWDHIYIPGICQCSHSISGEWGSRLLWLRHLIKVPITDIAISILIYTYKHLRQCVHANLHSWRYHFVIMDSIYVWGCENTPCTTTHSLQAGVISITLQLQNVY